MKRGQIGDDGAPLGEDFEALEREDRERSESDGYPPGWPGCAGGCGRPALDGHATCGELMCDEGAHR